MTKTLNKQTHKLTPQEKIEILERLDKGEEGATIAKDYGVRKQAVYYLSKHRDEIATESGVFTEYLPEYASQQVDKMGLLNETLKKLKEVLQLALDRILAGEPTHELKAPCSEIREVIKVLTILEEKNFGEGIDATLEQYKKEISQINKFIIENACPECERKYVDFIHANAEEKRENMS